MGIFNMFIVVPMLIQMVTLPLFYRSLLGGDPANVIRLAGTLLIVAAVCVLFRAHRAREPFRMKNQVQLITYVDRFGGGGLADLQALLTGPPLAGVFGGVHLLPFFHPSTVPMPASTRSTTRRWMPAWATGTT
jgi:hypothetical protein